MMLMDKPRRLSTDIDIIVEPGTDLDDYLEKHLLYFHFRWWKNRRESEKQYRKAAF